MTDKSAEVSMPTQQRVENDPGDFKTFHEHKLLGIFRTVYLTGRELPEAERAVLGIQDDDEVLMLAVEPIEGKFGLYDFLEGARESLRLVARYIKHNNLSPSFVYGLTYEAMAKASKRFGFLIKEITDPALINDESLETYFSWSPRAKKGKTKGKVMLAYMDRNTLIEKYSEP